jgi:hypothetical protein
MNNKKQFFLVLLLFCLFYYPVIAQKDTTKLDFDFGLTRDQDINVWPLLKYTRNKEERDLQLMFTLFRNQRNLQIPSKHNHFLPFYWNDSSNAGRDLRIGTLFYPSIAAYSKDAIKNTSSFRLFEIAPKINLMEVTNSPDGMYMENNFFFFVWYKNNKIENRSYFVVFPLYWGIKNEERTTRTIIPLFSKGSFHGNTDRYLAVTPFYWRFRTSAANRDVVFPLLWFKKEFKHNDTVVSKTIFPIYFANKNAYSNSKVFFPLVWSRKSWYSSFTVFPLFSTGKSGTDNNSHLAVTPFYWHFKTADGHKNLLFPLWWNEKEGEGSKEVRRNVVLPIFWSYKDQNKKNDVLFPILWLNKKKDYSSFTLVPFVSKGVSKDNGKKHLVITPLYWRITRYNSRTNLLFPLWYNKSKGFGDDRSFFNYIFPLYFDYRKSEISRQVLFPLVWSMKNNKYQSFTLMPLFSSGHNYDTSKSHFAVTPLFWHIQKGSSRFDFLFPIWWYKKKGSGEYAKYTHIILPIYFSHRSFYKNNKVVFPFYWKFKNEYYKSFTLIPVFSKGSSSDSSRTHYAVTCFYWHIKNKDKRRNILFPLYWNTRKGKGEFEKKSDVVFPLFWSFRKKDEKNNVLFPLVWQLKNYYRQSFTILPLFSSGHTNDNEHSHLVLTPFMWKIKNHDKERTVLFPLYWSFKEENEKKTVFFPLLWHNKTAFEHSLTFFPLFSSGGSADKSRSHLVITPLFWRTKNADELQNILFPLWWNIRKGKEAETEKTNVVFPLYWSKQDAYRNLKVFFPLIWKQEDPHYSSFTLFPLFSKGKSPVNENMHFAISPLIWKIRKADKTSFTLFPLFYSISDKEKESRKFNILYFVLRSSKTAEKSSFSLLWPVCEYASGKEYKYFRFTPFIWMKKSAEVNYFTFQPFYYHRVNDKSENYRLFWELYNFENFYGIKRSNNILWKLFFRDLYENGDHETRLIYLLYADVDKRGFKEKSIFPFYYHSSKPNGNQTNSWCFYFFNSIKREIPGTGEFYKEKRIFWLIRVKSNYQALIEKGLDKNIIKGK